MNEQITGSVGWTATRPGGGLGVMGRLALSEGGASTMAMGAGSATRDHGALIVRIAEHRDRKAFIALFQHYAPRIKSYLRRRGAGDGSAEDLAQEAMLAVWRKADRFDPSKAGAGTWIFTIARNLWIDAIRKERRPELDPADPLLVPEGPEEADRAVEVDERDTRLRQALETLPPAQAEVIRLAFFEDLTHADVAERLGLPLGTVKSRLRLAFDKVRGIVGEDP